jgi:hypothetical protein
MTDLIYGLILSGVTFVGIMALVIVIGRTIGRLFGPREDR